MFTPAVALLSLALAQPPSAAEALERAEKLYAADKFGEAEPLLRAATASDEPFLKRRAYNRLLALYLRSGRPDRALELAEPFGNWLNEVRDPAGRAALDLLCGQCRLDLGYPAEADEHLSAALGARALPTEQRLDALKLRGEAAALRKDPAERDRWTELQAAARDARSAAERDNVAAARVLAARFLADAHARLGDPAGALAALEPLPDLHDKLNDPRGRRDTQRARAKLFAGAGKYDEAAALFAEALELHRANDEKRRLLAGDLLAEWAAAAVNAKRLPDAAKLRERAATEYRAAIAAPSSDADAGGPLAAFVRLQALSRSARQFSQALEVALSAGERWSGDPLVDARLRADRGGLELLTAAYQEARKSLAAALAEHDATKFPNLRSLPKVLVNLATAELACDTPEKADPLLVRCAELYAKHQLPADPVLAEAAYLRGVSAARRADFAAAMAHFRAGLAHCGTAGKPADQVRFNLALNVALLYKEQGELAPASRALEEAATVLAGFTEPDDERRALVDAVRAELHVAQQQYGAALKLVPGIEAACAKNGLTSGYLWGTAKRVRALTDLSAGKVREAEAAWAELAAAQRKTDSPFLARSLNYFAACAELRGDSAAARKRFEESRAVQEKTPRCPPVTRAITLWRLAALADKEGQRAEAKKLLAEVFDVADAARMNTFGEAAQRAQFFAQFGPAFEQLVSWCARDGDGEGLLRALVRSRSRTLLDQMLAAGVDPRDRLPDAQRAPLLARETAARREVSRLRAQAMLLPADATDAGAKKVLADLDLAQKEFSEVWREIVNADPLTRALSDPAFAESALAQVRKTARDANAALLVYAVGRDRSFAVLCVGTEAPQVFPLGVAKPIAESAGEPSSEGAVARAGFRGAVLVTSGKQPERPARAPAVETVALTDAVCGRLVSNYLRQIADPAFSPTRGALLVTKTATETRAVVPEYLGDAVLPATLRAKLSASGATRVLLVPDGALHKVPFEALLVATASGPKFVLDELPAIAVAPSVPALAVVLARERKWDADALLTVGDPAYPSGSNALPRLPYTAVESKKVREFFPTDRVTAFEGAAATEAAVVKALPGKRFVHLAAHGFADTEFGNAFAAVALAPPAAGSAADPANDGFLTLHEILRLKLSGTELTVLSACVTNVGPQKPMEAGVTLAGAFLGAGSRGVMASCWSVDDRATSELMGAFFGAARPSNGKGLPHADALRAARLKVRGTQGWEAPFFWAPFVYVGPPE
jgi:hypothetical protein